FLDSSDLDHQPRFAGCVYARRPGGAVALAWPDVRELAARLPELTRPGAFDAYCVSPPARFNERPVAFVAGFAAGALAWPAEIGWDPAPRDQPPEVHRALQIPSWPDDLAARYEEDLRIADGEQEARFPQSGATARFRNKGAFQPDHDLERMVDYLEERYHAL